MNNNFLVKSADLSAINSFIEQLVNCDNEENIKLILFDSTHISFARFQNNRHLLIPIANDVEKIHGLFSWLIATVKERQLLLSQFECLDVKSFNSLAKAIGHEVLSNIYLIINEAYYIRSELSKEDYIPLFLDSAPVGIHIILFTKFSPSKLQLGLAADLLETCSIQQLNNYFFD